MGRLDTLVEEQLSADDSGSNLSSVSHRQRHRAAGGRKHEPFYIYNKFDRLRTRVKLFRSETSLLLE